MANHQCAPTIFLSIKAITSQIMSSYELSSIVGLDANNAILRITPALNDRSCILRLQLYAPDGLLGRSRNDGAEALAC